jgi:hypothetical protein
MGHFPLQSTIQDKVDFQPVKNLRKVLSVRYGEQNEAIPMHLSKETWDSCKMGRFGSGEKVDV